MLAWRYLCHWIEGTRGLLHPYLLHLSVFQEHLHERRLGIVQSYNGTVRLVNGIIDYQHIVDSLTFLGLAILLASDASNFLTGGNYDGTGGYWAC